MKAKIVENINDICVLILYNLHFKLNVTYSKTDILDVNDYSEHDVYGQSKLTYRVNGI